MLAALLQGISTPPLQTQVEEDEEEQPSDEALPTIFDDSTPPPVVDFVGFTAPPDDDEDEEQDYSFVGWPALDGDVIGPAIAEEEEEEQEEAQQSWAALDGDFIAFAALEEVEEEQDEYFVAWALLDEGIITPTALEDYEDELDESGWNALVFDAAAALDTTYIIQQLPDDGADAYELEWDPEGWIPQIFDVVVLLTGGMLVPWPSKWMTFEQWAGTLIDDNPERVWPYRPTELQWRFWAAEVQSTLNLSQPLPSPAYYQTWQEWVLASVLTLVTG